MLSCEIMFLWTIIFGILIAVYVAGSADHVNKYGRQALLDLRPPADTPPPVYLLRSLKRLEEKVFSSHDGMKNTSRKPGRKRGRRGGVRAKLRRRGIRTPLPAVTFGNVRSIRNKMDEFAANCKYIRDYRESGFIALTETWLQEKDDDWTVSVDGFSLVRGDRKDTVKQRGGGVAVYINDKWCTQVNVKEQFCCDDLEYLVIACRPFYLPREFNNVIIITVYIPPDANTTTASELLLNCVNKCENANPEGIKIVLGDFNHCDFQPSVPSYQQTVTCPTRGNTLLDKMYCNISNGYRAYQKPKLGDSDHNMVFLAPTYKQKLKNEPCEKRCIQDWKRDHIVSLQGCFDCTDWNAIYSESDDINANLDVFNSYIKFCTDMIVPVKVVTIYPNNKPWMNSDIKRLIIEKKENFVNGDHEQLKVIQRQLNKKISDAKRTYKDKIENLFRSNKPKDAWSGVKLLCGFKRNRSLLDPPNIKKYVNELNSFYARFDVHDFKAECENILSVVKSSVAERIIVTHGDVLNSLRLIKCGKASGPDNISSKLLKSCAEQLANPLSKFFQISLDQNWVPDVWKTSEIVPVPKQKYPKEFNDLRPVALTSIIMKCLEHIIKKHLCKSIDTLSDPFQFAYCQGRSVQDAGLTLMHQICQHLETRNSQVRILFVDFSSAFNTIQPHVLLNKLLRMKVNGNIILWIYSYLSQRPQYTRIKEYKSDIIYTNTGAPQGCVLSPLLFTLYTNDCNSNHHSTSIIKYAEDTAIIGKLSNDNANYFLAQVNNFVSWCKDNYLNLNVRKTKEMVIDFRVKNNVPDPIVIENIQVERVQEYKYLGILIDNKLSGSENTHYVYKKCQQCIHFLRVLKNVHVDSSILSLFYKSVIESILCFSITIWFGKLKCKDKSKMKKIVKNAGRLKAKTVPLDELYNCNVIKQVNQIMSDPKHPLNCNYVFLRSGRKQCTNRFKNSFVPKSIKLYNHLITQ